MSISRSDGPDILGPPNWEGLCEDSAKRRGHPAIQPPHCFGPPPSISPGQRRKSVKFADTEPVNSFWTRIERNY